MINANATQTRAITQRRPRRRPNSAGSRLPDEGPRIHDRALPPRAVSLRGFDRCCPLRVALAQSRDLCRRRQHLDRGDRRSDHFGLARGSAFRRIARRPRGARFRLRRAPDGSSAAGLKNLGRDRPSLKDSPAGFAPISWWTPKDLPPSLKSLEAGGDWRLNGGQDLLDHCPNLAPTTNRLASTCSTHRRSRPAPRRHPCGARNRRKLACARATWF